MNENVEITCNKWKPLKMVIKFPPLHSKSFSPPTLTCPTAATDTKLQACSAYGGGVCGLQCRVENMSRGRGVGVISIESGESSLSCFIHFSINLAILTSYRFIPNCHLHQNLPFYII
ncbi:hypothetical protein HELRODRAFT_162823 [Helobdella robusta]|uniref:Uncharacterized protein n=1 Tax=Helobdella robusta TaxID=6412 RepID=T1ET79_HELRO|nr:hypothetical protein HELRODRAFT_162823 [Helobdella robusta]ESN99303.1 hypothetical protein HELRODRAFT_162823 [Helobdella robusta]